MTDSTAALISSNPEQGTEASFHEVKNQVLIALPFIVTNLHFHLTRLISIMFARHLGELELAEATLANAWATTTGFVVMVGLSGALETLCGQGFEARDYRMLGIHLQASCIVSLPFTIFIAILWFYTEPILISIRQDQQIAKYTALYIKYFIPGLFPYAILQNILRFMQTQSVILPLYFFSVIQMVVHVVITYSLVHWTALRYKGAPLAASISIWISMLMLVVYVMRAKKFKRT